MTAPHMPRRRFLGLVAASAALVGPGSLQAALQNPGNLPEPVIWNGIALGADAQLQLLHPDRAHAQQLLHLALAELRRLEQVFSLYQDDSALVHLNRQGRLDAPPWDLSRLLAQAIAFGDHTDGRFDPSVQTLWHLYTARVLAGQPLPPDPVELQAALSRVDYRAIRIDDDAIAFDRPGMALTLNGIAQGYITDRVTELLRAHGLEHAMIDLGEARSLGQSGFNRPWRAGIADPRQPDHILETIDLADQALATSGGYGTPLDPKGPFTHLFDPRTGSAIPRWRSVTVRAGDATTADALSTAFSLMSADEIHGMISRFPVQAWLVPSDDDTLIRLG